MAGIFHRPLSESEIRGKVLSACIHGMVNAIALPQFAADKSATETRGELQVRPWETVLGVFGHEPNYKDSFELAARNEAAKAFSEMLKG